MSIFTSVKHRIAAALSPQQMTQQLSKTENNWMSQMYGGNYKVNPDDRTYTDYDEMFTTDPQVRGGTNLITQLLLSRKLIVTPLDDSPQAKEQADFMESCLDQMDYPLRQVRTDLYTAIQYGYSVSENIFKYDDSIGTDTSGKIVIRKIRPIDIATLHDCFEMNDEGDIINVMQRNTDGEDIPIPIEKCMKYTHGERFGNPYGNSLYQSVYDNWYQKRKVLKWWNVFLQKHEGPTLVGKIGTGSGFKDIFRQQLEEIREGRTQITIGAEDDVQVLESSHRGEGFQEAIRYHDTMILHGMNIGPLLIGQDQSTGSYGQSKTQENITFIYLDGVHEDVASEFEKLSKQLCGINFPNPLPPVISFESFEEDDILGLLRELKPYIDSFVINSGDKWLKELISKAVEQYSDITVPIEEETMPEQPVKVTPTPEDINTPLDENQQGMIEQVAQVFPGQEPTPTKVNQ